VSESVTWAQPPENHQTDEEQNETPGEVDETFAVRRLRRWLQGMFGPSPKEREEPPET
jgi:hypothetical protein